MEILTGEQMRNVDRRAIEEFQIPSLRLMESAGRGVAEALLDDYPLLDRRAVVVLCGKGNNGGDGMVVARHLLQNGVRVRVLLLASASELKSDAATNFQSARDHGVEIVELLDEAAWAAARESLDGDPLVVDAILGTGIRGGARGLAATVIDDLNRGNLTVVSIDVPSGLDSDSGEVTGAAVRATATYTLCRPKLALVLEPAAALAGHWKVIPIGIPDEAVQPESSPMVWLDRNAARALLPRRPAASHKGTYGHLLLLAGSPGKSGAAVLAARAALRAGAGLVTVATAPSVQSQIAVQQAEVMTEPLPEDSTGSVAEGSVPRLLSLMEDRQALAIGPGLGTSPETRAAVRALIERRTLPTVVDADGLNALASVDGLSTSTLRAAASPLILTPHPGEAARLLGIGTSDVQADRPAAVSKLARDSGAVVVLKGHRTLIAGPDREAIAVNGTGNPGMASAGTGDVLTGMVGAFLARGLNPWDAACLAAFAHGEAGDRAAAILGQDGMIASDLIDELPGTLRSLGGQENGRW